MLLVREELQNIQFGDVRDKEIIRKCYKENVNCKVTDNPKTNGNICILFISSNSIYFPNTEEAVESTIQGKDRYEWTNLAQMEPINTEVARAIFIRDIYKQWYISGINERIDGIEKLVDYLKDLTTGYRLIIVGNSSGGYLAALLSQKLEAEKAFSISGQWDISDQAPKAPFIKAEMDTGYAYLNITEEAPNCPIFYLYPLLCKWDQEQSALVKEKENIIHIPFKQEGHGATCFGFNLPLLFLLDKTKLYDLSKLTPVEGWKRTSFLFKSVGYIRGIKLLIAYYIHKVCKVK